MSSNGELNTLRNVLDKSHEGNSNTLCLKSAAKIRNISLFCKFLGDFFCGFKGKM